MPVLDKETAFAERIRPDEKKWVALVEKDGEEIVAGSGETPAAALADAKEKGFTNTTLFSLPSFSETFVY
jgi:hypothetical protein